MQMLLIMKNVYVHDDEYKVISIIKNTRMSNGRSKRILEL